MARNISPQDISWFLDLHGKGQLNLDPPYQRRSVWSPKDRQFFIDTILNDYPAPPVFLHKTLDDYGRTTYHVVDGKQRLQTIIEFQNGKIRVPDNFADVTLQKKTWSDLERGSKEKFWNYLLIVEMVPDVSDASVRNIFDRINRNSRNLVPQEMRHARYGGWFAATAEGESEKAEWKNFGLATAARLKRMSDVQFLAELFQVVINRQLQGFDQDALDDIYAKYEDLSEDPTFVEDDFLEEVEKIKSYIAEALGWDATLRSFLKIQVHFYSLWGYLVLEKDRLLSPEEFMLRYMPFMSLVQTALNNSDSSATSDEAVLEYAVNVRGANTDLNPRLKRHSALVKALHGNESVPHEDN